jgi:hypothetical protein
MITIVNEVTKNTRCSMLRMYETSYIGKVSIMAIYFPQSIEFSVCSFMDKNRVTIKNEDTIVFCYCDNYYERYSDY